MASARSFLLVLGAVFAVTGLVVARTVDDLLGLGILVVGAFLVILPFTAYRPEE